MVDIMRTLVLVCQGERGEEEEEEDEAPVLAPEDEKKIKELFLESSLLPAVEAALRAGSILEMSKELDLNLAYLALVEAFAQKKSLFGLLLPIDEVYEPRQRESVCSLLSTAATMAKVFLDCMDPEQGGEPKLKRTKSFEEKQKESDKPKQLSERLVAVSKMVSEKAESSGTGKKQLTLEQLSQMPVEEAYAQLLTPLRV